MRLSSGAGATLLQVNDTAVSYCWTEEIFNQKDESQTVDFLLSRRKATKPFLHKMSQPDILSTHQHT
jgi:hypothetical protein